jgi:hypothetical protein
MAEKAQPEKEIRIKFPDELIGGVYCNLLYVTHTKEEFILDFIMVSPPRGSVVSRVIMSPGHMKRTLSALQENLKKYESSISKIVEAPEPTKGKGKIGFRTT